MAGRRPSVVGEPTGPPRQEEGGPVRAPSGARTHQETRGVASHSSRRNGGAGFPPIQRSRRPHLKTPFGHAARPGHGPRKAATERRPRPAHRRKPGSGCAFIQAFQRGRSSAFARRTSTSDRETRRGPPGTPGRLPCGRASPCPEPRTGSTGTSEGADRTGPRANLHHHHAGQQENTDESKRGNALRGLPGGRPTGPLPRSETRAPKGPTPRRQRPGPGSAQALRWPAGGLLLSVFVRRGAL